MLHGLYLQRWSELWVWALVQSVFWSGSAIPLCALFLFLALAAAWCFGPVCWQMRSVLAALRLAWSSIWSSIARISAYPLRWNKAETQCRQRIYDTPFGRPRDRLPKNFYHKKRGADAPLFCVMGPMQAFFPIPSLFLVSAGFDVSYLPDVSIARRFCEMCRILSKRKNIVVRAHFSRPPPLFEKWIFCVYRQKYSKMPGEENASKKMLSLSPLLPR